MLASLEDKILISTCPSVQISSIYISGQGETLVGDCRLCFTDPADWNCRYWEAVTNGLVRHILILNLFLTCHSARPLCKIWFVLFHPALYNNSINNYTFPPIMIITDIWNIFCIFLIFFLLDAYINNFNNVHPMNKADQRLEMCSAMQHQSRNIRFASTLHDILSRILFESGCIACRNVINWFHWTSLIKQLHPISLKQQHPGYLLIFRLNRNIKE